MTPTKFSDSDIDSLIRELNASSEGWALEDGKVTKQFQFKDFVSAFGFMTQCALYAEKADHHPEWFNVYNRVKVQLCTHDVSGISEKDAAMAKYMDSLYN